MTIENQANAKSILEVRLGSRIYRFSPRPLATLATVMLLPFLLALGFWQLHRAEIKQQILTQFQTNSTIVPLVTHTTLNEPYPEQFQRISVKGHFVPEMQIFLDNRFNAHRIGYEVITPFKLHASDIYLLVNRGWIPRERNRSNVPHIETPSAKKTITLSGYVSYPSSRSLLLGPNVEAVKSGSTIVQTLQIDSLSDLLQHSLYPFALLLNEEQPYGFTRDWAPVTMSPDMHHGYAVQWFSLAISLLIIYIAVNLKSEKSDA